MSNKFKIMTDMSKELKDNNLCFVIFQGGILAKKEDNALSIPTYDEVIKLNIKFESEIFIGEFDEKPCFAIRADSEFRLSDKLELVPLYDIGPMIEEELFLAIGRANQILNWDITHKFCGKCGSKTENKKDEMAKICPSCNHVMYPVICPAIIVAVTKGDKLLLAHNKGFKNNMYSLIAGFAEAGEDLISTVKREVFEEVGIKIKNITYYMSAPWSFPNSLMIGFLQNMNQVK